ncbi:MAG: hypothetical protein WA749_12915, partial [Gelidibacter sp.]
MENKYITITKARGQQKKFSNSIFKLYLPITIVQTCNYISAKPIAMTKNYFSCYTVALFVFVSFFSFSLFAQESLPENFDTWIESGRKDWRIPGMA